MSSQVTHIGACIFQEFNVVQSRSIITGTYTLINLLENFIS